MKRAAFLLLVLLPAACSHKREQPSFANAPVILISIDTLRSDHLPAYGYRGVATPNLDAFRADATLFQRAYSHCPMTLPSHLSILTGLLPTEHGVRNNIGYRFERGRFPTLASLLRAHGYRTGAAVSSYVLRSDTGVDDGFDSYEDGIPIAAAGAASEHQRSGFVTLGHADRWISEHAGSPLFFFFHIYEPHAPYAAPEPYRNQTSDAYDAEIATSDAIAGKLLARLKALGIYDRAIIVLLSDHGEGLNDHGEDQHGILLNREALQVPLLVKLPHSQGRGSTVARPVALIDVFPTILDLTGIQPSIRSLFAAAAPSRPIYSETLYPRIHLGWSELRSLIDERYHYIAGVRAELFDVVTDPTERKDLSSEERRVSSERRTALQAYPSAMAPIQRVDPEEAAKLAALGYVGTPKNRTGALPDPRDEISTINEVKAAFRLADQGHADEAVVAFRKLLHANPRLSDVQSRLGEVLIESGRYDEAIDTYKAAIASSERFSPDLSLALGFALLKAGRIDDALAHARLALAMNPREANELMARALVEARRFDEAEADARRAIELGDRQPASILLLAEVQRGRGQLREALTTIDEAGRRAGDLEVPHLYGIDYLRGDVLARLDRPEEAATAFRREIASSPGYLQAYTSLALIDLIGGRRPEAESVLEAMVRRNPHRGAYRLAAKTLEAAGDHQGAARWLARGTPR
jgi:arylsulfatase A-like enzyme/Flp pilus assembly protein TadD